jgi:hypothetical protein
VDNLWKKNQPVEKTDKEIAFPYFHRLKIVSACGNVENFIQMLINITAIKQF